MTDRVICSECGYDNSTRRISCKGCHIKLNKVSEVQDDQIVETIIATQNNMQTQIVPVSPQNKSDSIIRKFLNEEQDPAIINRVYTKVSEILTSEEKILYIAVQNKPIVTIAPDSVVITNRRFIIYKPKMLGRVDFEDYIWRDLRDARLKENILGATITLKTVKNHTLAVDYLPKMQARKLYSIAQEMEENVREERRTRRIEEKRAAAGGVIVHNELATSETQQITSVDDPVQKLAQLKQMMDMELITADEYETKKGEILSRM